MNACHINLLNMLIICFTSTIAKHPVHSVGNEMVQKLRPSLFCYV